MRVGNTSLPHRHHVNHQMASIDEGTCVGRAAEWDLDVVEDDYAAATRAQAACFACPVLARCRAELHQLVDGARTPPRQMIQAAVAFGDDGQPIAPGRLRAHMLSTTNKRRAAEVALEQRAAARGADGETSVRVA